MSEQRGRGVEGGEHLHGLSPQEAKRARKGVLAWAASNSVVANLIMVMLIIGGLVMAPKIKQEVFPEVIQDIVQITIPYPGASPAEVEQGVILAIEDEVRGLDGVKEVTATAQESVATISVELLSGINRDAALNDVQRAVDRVTSLPADTERPVITLVSNRREVVSLILYGDTDEQTLKRLGERVRDELLQDKRITAVEVEGVREPEISVEIPQESLRRYGLTLDAVAAAITRASVELPGGGVRTEGGEVLLRTRERRDEGEGFESIVVTSRPDGGKVTVGALGRVVDGFQDSDYKQAYYNGKRAVRVKVFRVGDQSPITVSDAVQEYQKRAQLPEGIGVAVWSDTSEIFRDRIDLLMRNAYSGLLLVLVCLAIFLDIRLAFWVAMGIPVSFLGAMLLMPALGVSINMISLFAFILTLGIVVDDAIVVGEAVHHRRSQGFPRLQAAILGVKDVAGPVVFSVLTTVAAFVPLLFIPGVSGKFFGVIPLIVIPILLMSLFESLFTLPAHLAHMGEGGWGPLGWVVRGQAWFSRGFERLIEVLFRPVARAAIRWRYLTLAIALGTAVIVVAYTASGRLRFTFLPQTEGDTVTVGVRLPFGAPIEATKEVQARVLRAGQEVLEELGGEAELSRGLYSEVGYARPVGGAGGGGPTVGSHVTQVALFLVPMDKRTFTTAEFAKRWRERVGEVAGVETLTFAFTTGLQAGSPIDVQLSHPDVEVLEGAAEALGESLRGFAGVFGVDNGLSRGKEQLDLKLKAEARALGLTELELARQVRGAFFGAEAARQQRGRDELRVFVRRPLSERQSEYAIEGMMVRTPGGGEMALGQAAEVERGRAYTQIRRKDGRRVISVTADVDLGVTTAGEVLAKVDQEVLPGLLEGRPGLTATRGGEQQAQAESLGALRTGFGLALLAMFALMALAFKSYVQPIIVMVAIPFGVVGALLGHIGMGYDLSLMSIMGMIALSGVVVNDSIVMVDAVNTFRREGMETFEAVLSASVRRFRPILLTSLTTFLGLVPMIFETSVQARFLIPMAVGLGFGVLFTTPVALLVVPSIYMLIEDVRWVLGGVKWLVVGPGEVEEGLAGVEGVVEPEGVVKSEGVVEPDGEGVEVGVGAAEGVVVAK